MMSCKLDWWKRVWTGLCLTQFSFRSKNRPKVLSAGGWQNSWVFMSEPYRGDLMVEHRESSRVSSIHSLTFSTATLQLS